MGKIQYPIEVSDIKTIPLYRNSNKPDGLFGAKCGALISVRPCGEEYGNKTYLGIMLGDLPLDIFITHNPKTKELEVGGFSNPAIFVPELRQIIWGCGSWWSEIENEEQLRQITDDDIQNVWYVKMLKAMQEEKTTPLETKESAGEQQTTMPCCEGEAPCRGKVGGELK